MDNMNYLNDWSIGKLKAFLQDNGVDARRMKRVEMIPLAKMKITNKMKPIHWHSDGGRS